VKLNTLYLKNIRSYTEELVKFNQGTMLFEGSSGCGKSTLLMAIEFALFGLGNVKGNSLLRTGEKEGIVKLNFSVENEEYEVHRKITRTKKTATQSSDACYIKTKDGILPLSPSELKAKILEILHFNEPSDPKAKSVIFTYAVFTPQEEMKTILFDDPERRLQTLRKAFRIEGYKTAVENASLLATEIVGKAKELNGESKGFEDDILKKKRLEDELNGEGKKIAPLEDKKRAELENRADIQGKLNEKRNQRLALGEIVGKLPVIQKRKDDADNEIKRLTQKIGKAQTKISELQPKRDQLAAIQKPTDKDAKTIETEIEELEKKERGLRKKESVFESKIEEYSKVSESGICPTCDRPADPAEFSQKIVEKTSQKEQISSDINIITGQIKGLRELLQKLKDYQDAQGQLKTLDDQLRQASEDMNEDNKRKNELDSQLTQDIDFIEKAKTECLKLEELDRSIADLDRQDKEKETLIGSIQDSLTKLKEKMSGMSISISEMQETIEKKQSKKKQSEELNEYAMWIKDYFIPTLQTIETKVLASINEEFNEKFRQWFTTLVEDATKDGRIDENFTPIIEQDGYEQDVAFLSGGEKTSVALSYRLSLNSLVQKVSAGIQSNLLILDEPTDGFSREQLFKVRDILNEIKCPQVILVSHEKELESFADHIFKVIKTNGVSKVAQENQ